MREFSLYTWLANTAAGPSGYELSFTVTSIGGSLDVTSAPMLDEHLFVVLVQRGPCMALELSDLKFLDSSGLSTMITYWKLAQESGGTLRLVAAPSHVTAMLRRTGLDRYLINFPDILSLLGSPHAVADART